MLRLLALIILGSVACQANGQYVEEFWSPQCGPCLRMNPIIDNCIKEGYNIKRTEVEIYSMTLPQQHVYLNGKCILRHKGTVNAATYKSYCDMAQPDLRIKRELFHIFGFTLFYKD